MRASGATTDQPGERAAGRPSHEDWGRGRRAPTFLPLIPYISRRLYAIGDGCQEVAHALRAESAGDSLARARLRKRWSYAGGVNYLVTMPLVMDPAGYETRALRQAVSWRGKRVLEVGCGDGRLTLRLAQLGARSILAIDPDAALVRGARKALPERYRARIRYQVGSAERLRKRKDLFDIAVLSWSL